MSERDRAQWREYITPSDFFNFTEWDRNYLGFFLQEVDAYVKQGISFPDWLLSRAQANVGILHHILEYKSLNTQTNWKSIPFHPGMTMTERSADVLMYVWIQVKKFDYLFVSLQNESDCANMLAILLPKTKREERESWDKPVALAFHREERLSLDGRRPSELVLRKLLQYSTRPRSRITSSICNLARWNFSGTRLESGIKHTETSSLVLAASSTPKV